MLSQNDFLRIGEHVVHGFKVDEYNLPVVEKIYQYINRDKEFETGADGMDLNKGILLCGNPGSGKTGLIKIMQKAFNCFNSPLKFAGGIAWKIAMDYKKTGIEVMDKYDQGHWFFDELGKINPNGYNPEVASNYGDKINVVEVLIEQRYNLFVDKTLLTHYTTNLSDQQLREYYHERVYSRLKMMCNFIPVVGVDRRKGAKIKPIVDILPESKALSKEELYKFAKLEDTIKIKSVTELKKEEENKKGVSVNFFTETREGRLIRLRDEWRFYCQQYGIDPKILKQFRP